MVGKQGIHYLVANTATKYSIVSYETFKFLVSTACCLNIDEFCRFSSMHMVRCHSFSSVTLRTRPVLLNIDKFSFHFISFHFNSFVGDTCCLYKKVLYKKARMLTLSFLTVSLMNNIVFCYFLPYPFRFLGSRSFIDNSKIITEEANILIYG